MDAELDSADIKTDDLVRLLGSLPDATLLIDAEGRVVSANDRAERLFGYSAAQLAENDLSRIVGADADEALLRADTGSLQATTLLRRADGTEFAAEVSVRRLAVGGSQVSLTAIRDTSWRDEVEHEARLAWQALDAAFDSIVVLKPDGTIIYFNPAAARMLGYTMEEFASTQPWQWAGEDPKVRAERLEQLKEAGHSSMIQTAYDSRGRELFLEINSRWIETPDGPIIVSVARDVTEVQRTQQMLREMAFHDPLTQLANRALLDDRLAVAMGNARRHGDLLGVAFIDLDDFKEVNDRYGHATGDRVLVALARRLQRAVREEDTVARLGGDEFLVVLPRLSDPADLDRRAAELLDEIAAPVEIDGVTHTMHASIGLALFDPDTDDARSLMMKADIAMYEAKRGERRGFRIFTEREA